MSKENQKPSISGKLGESLIESNFRRLLASIEEEREKIRIAWKSLDDQKEKTKKTCSEMKEETEKWCFEERLKIGKSWEEVKEIHRHIDCLVPTDDTILEINCSGTHFQIRRGSLVSVTGSHLNQLFSNEFQLRIPKDDQGRYILDFNPVCFGLVLDWLKNKRLSVTGLVPLPPVPPEQRANMDVLCEALKLTQFIPPNQLATTHQTSLNVQPSQLKALHDGWQIITAQYPMRMSRKSYFEIKIESNSDPRGGLAVGVVGHIPSGVEIHSLKQRDGILYNSNNGLIQTECCGLSDIMRQVMFKEGSSVGVEFDPTQHLVKWFFNSQLIGSCAFKHDCVDQIQNVYPCFALYASGQRIKIDFQARIPTSGDAPFSKSGSAGGSAGGGAESTKPAGGE